MPLSRLEALSFCLQNVVAERLVSIGERLGEFTITLRSSDLLRVMQDLRDHSDLAFDILIDLCGVDYSTYGAVSVSESERKGQRFAVVYHLLS